jgi:hypothetical protein
MVGSSSESYIAFLQKVVLSTPETGFPMLPGKAKRAYLKTCEPLFNEAGRDIRAKLFFRPLPSQAAIDECIQRVKGVVGVALIGPTEEVLAEIVPLVYQVFLEQDGDK